MIHYETKRIGKLRIIRKQYTLSGERGKMLCLCDCGISKIIRQNYLTGKNPTQSCGCLRKESAKIKRKGYGEASLRNLYCKYKDSAKSREFDFDLTIEQFKDLTSSDCHYCGSKPSKIIQRKTNYGEYTFNGIDRLDNNLGYTLKNSLPCCTTCNYAKHSLPYDVFNEWIKTIVDFRIRKSNDSGDSK